MKNSVLISCPKCGRMIYGRLWRCPGCGHSDTSRQPAETGKSRQKFWRRIFATLKARKQKVE